MWCLLCSPTKSYFRWLMKSQRLCRRFHLDLVVWVFINRCLNQGEDCWKINSATMFPTLIKVCFMLFLALIEIQLRGLGESPPPCPIRPLGFSPVFWHQCKKRKKTKRWWITSQYEAFKIYLSWYFSQLINWALWL